MKKNKTTGVITPTPKNKFKICKALILLTIMVGVFTSCGYDKEKSVTEQTELVFEPKESITCTDNKITISADIDCPDGTIIQTSLLSGNLKEHYSDKPVVKDKKITSTFELTNTDPKVYGGMIILQFNADDVIQPQNVKSFYGEYGEQLTGANLIDNKTDDGKTGMYTFDVPYPSEEAVNELKDSLYKEFVDYLVTNVDTVNSVERDSDAYFVSVTDDWHFMTQDQKQRYADELLNLIATASENIYSVKDVSLTIYDESENVVATSKIGGGMEIK